MKVPSGIDLIDYRDKHPRWSDVDDDFGNVESTQPHNAVGMRPCRGDGVHVHGTDAGLCRRTQ